MAKLSRAYDTELMQKSGTRLDGRPAAVYSGPPQHDTSPSKPCGIAHRCGWMWQAICVAPSASKSRCSANPASTSTIRTRNTPSVPSPATSAVCTCDQSCVPPSNTSHRTRRRDRLLKGMGDSDGDAGVERKSTDRPPRPTSGPSTTRPRSNLLPPRPPGGTPCSRLSQSTPTRAK